MVNDVLDETRRRLAASGVETSADVRRAGRSLAGFSEEMAREERALKIFLYQRMYRSGPVKAVADEAERVLSRLFDAYSADICLLPPQWQPGAPEPVPTLRAIGDFLAGLTDRSEEHTSELQSLMRN